MAESSSGWARLLTEQRNPRSAGIDRLDVAAAVALVNEEDRRVPEAVGEVLPDVAAAVDLVVAALSRGGRLIYVGAGTSGRLGVLDAAECPPTFGSSPDQVQGVIAGGPGALVRSQEGAEDRPDDGAAAVADRRVGPDDVVMGIAASGVTPFVIGALDAARKAGAATVLFSCNPDAAARVPADVRIVPKVGPEVIAGSTRLKAGTATKLVLNTITTVAMVRLGKVYENLMVDLQPTCQKLRDRARRILAAVGGLDEAAAARLLDEAGDLKTALVVTKRAVSKETARRLLQENGGIVRRAIEAR